MFVTNSIITLNIMFMENYYIEKKVLYNPTILTRLNYNSTLFIPTLLSGKILLCVYLYGVISWTTEPISKVMVPKWLRLPGI